MAEKKETTLEKISKAFGPYPKQKKHEELVMEDYEYPSVCDSCNNLDFGNGSSYWGLYLCKKHNKHVSVHKTCPEHTLKQK